MLQETLEKSKLISPPDFDNPSNVFMPPKMGSAEMLNMQGRDNSGSKILQMMQKHNQMNQIPTPVDEDQDDLFNAINKVDHSQ